MKMLHALTGVFELPFYLAWLVRRLLYYQRLIPTKRLPRPVISIGNLTFGGTGKTPFIDWVLTNCEAEKINVAVISRGYGGTYKKSLRATTVNISESNKSATSDIKSARYYGDEITWLKRKHPHLAMAVGQTRFEAGLCLAQSDKPDLFISDDGFQHWQLKRDLDVVLIDASCGFEELRLFPRGRGREPLRALLRADFLVWTKTQLISAKELYQLQLRLKNYFGEGARHLIMENRQTTLQCEKQLNNRVLTASDLKTETVVLLSAIARPQPFEVLARQNGIQFVRHFVYPDHYYFSSHELAKIEQWCLGKNITCLLTTEKDFERLRYWQPSNLSIWTLCLKWSALSGEDEFFQELRTLSQMPKV